MSEPLHAGRDQHAGPGHPTGPGQGQGHDQGHDQHAGHDPEMFRRRFWLSLLLTVPVVVTSDSLMEWFGYSLEFPGRGWVAPVLGTVVFGYGGSPFLAGAVAEARARRPGMMLLIGMAITVSFLASWSATLDLFAVEVWWEMSLLIVIMLLGHWLEMRAIGQAQGALAALAELLPDQAERVTPGGEVEPVPVSALSVGDVVMVRPGGRVPADGTIVAGFADLDESMLTG
jgi:Cu2+-exporting ATPase